MDGPDFGSDCKVIESAHNFKGQETGHILRCLDKLFILLNPKKAETVDAITIVVLEKILHLLKGSRDGI